jgi:hypothetical protein
MRRDERDEVYNSAQICTNGHVITEVADEMPHLTSDRCRACGAETITNCPACRAKIRGDRFGGNVPAFRRPAFCHNCGKPYPWTEATIRAAKELAQELKISADDKMLLETSIDQLVRNTPAATVAAVRFKTIVAKAGREVAEGFHKILVDVVSEIVKKTLWP